MIKIKKLFSEYNDGFIFFIQVVICEFILRINAGLDFSKKAILINFLIVAFIYVLLMNLSKRIRKIIELVLLILISIYTLAQNYHFYFFGTFFSFTKLAIVNELGGVFNEIIVKFNFNLLLYLFPLIIFILYIVFDRKHNNKTKFSWLRLLISILIAVAIVFGYQRLFYLPEEIAWDYNTGSDEYLYHNMPNKLQFMNRFGTLCFIESDIRIIQSKSSTNITEEQKKEINDYISTKTQIANKYTGIFKDKNIVFVLAESLAPYGINKDITPTLYKLSQEGFYFDNFYAPLYPANTSDSEFIALTSLMPSLYNGTTSKVYDKNYYPYALPQLFKNNGYNANSYHSFIKGFYNRESLHSSFGINFFFDRDDLQLPRWDGFKDEINWIDDELLFDAAMKNTNTNGKFFDFIISGSGHMPYTELREELLDGVSKLQKQYPDIPVDLLYYYSAQIKLDKALSVLIDGLKAKGIYEDTVIVIFGDHYPYGGNEKLYNELFLDGREDFEKYKTPFIIYNPSLKGETIHTLSSTFDILPTLSNMFGLDLPNAFLIGNDIMSEHESKVIFGDGSILTNNYYYQSDGSDIKVFNEDFDYSNDIKYTNKLIDLSQLVLSSDYYKSTK